MRILLLAVLAVLAGCQRSSAPPPPLPPTAASEANAQQAAPTQETPKALVDMPDVPDFALPPTRPGFHSVKQLRVKSRQLFGTRVKVEGYVVWIYDCARDIAEPGMSRAEIERILSDEPERCTRPNFYLAANERDKPERALWIVEVPRPPRPDELEYLSEETLANWPEWPTLTEGDRVVVTGMWKDESPAGFVRGDGLVVYESLEHVR